MFKKMSIRLKLFLSIILVISIIFIIVIATVSLRSIQMAKDDAFSLADEMAAKYSYEIKAELQAARVTSESLMTVFQTLIERGEADRDMLNAVLQNSLQQKQYIISFCVAFEPNKLDGKDEEYAGQYPLYGESGRYAPYWNMLDGELNVEPLENFDNDLWYAGARDTGKEYITDPFFYEVQGTQVLMTSLVFPIMIDGEFIGIVSSDMALDSLQDMVSQVNTSGLGEYTEIYSNSGIIVAQPNDEYFNKNLYAVSVYNMLLEEPGKTQDALDIVNGYIQTAQLVEHDNAALCAENLAAYLQDPVAANLDLTVIPNDLAIEVLHMDEDRFRVADTATQAIANGETYAVTEDGYYKVYMPIQFSEATNPWSVAVGVPISEILDRSNEIRNYVIIVSALGIALIAGLLYLLTRNLTQPILELADSAKKVGEGNFDVDIPDTKNSDEVGILSTAFRTMVAQINDLVSKLTRNSEELEKKNEHLGELNEKLIDARDQAEASNRAKSVFLSNMSHEMRTPLNAIVGMTTIGLKASNDAKKDDSFRKIDEASGHLLALVNDVLDLSKMEANKLELSRTKFAFAKLLEDTNVLISTQLKDKNQTLRVEADEDIPEFFVGDDFRLSQVLINLLSNAVKFTEDQKEIALKAFIKERSGEQYLIQFEVTDPGIGISEEHLPKLFNMFEQADKSTTRSFGGSGIGLALSKRIVEMMGGEIWVESEPGVGSTFFFTVKLERCTGDNPDSCDDSTKECGDVPATTEVQRDFSGKRILLAEDIEINREIVIAMLEDTNVEIECAENGRVACEKYAENPGRYDLILMDIQMPEMDGIEATRQIRKDDKEVPIIALTANVFSDDVDSYLECGINCHIGKPLDYDLTMEVLDRYLNKA